jgi:hypothetical protein
MVTSAYTYLLDIIIGYGVQSPKYLHHICKRLCNITTEQTSFSLQNQPLPRNKFL